MSSLRIKEIADLWQIIVKSFQELMAYLEKEYDYFFLVVIEFLEYGWIIVANLIVAVFTVFGNIF